MLADISELSSGAEIRARVCIVGGGAAGITLARRLAANKIDVLLLESGGMQIEPQVQALCRGQTGAVQYYPLDGVRLRYFGGTTNHWTGQSVPFDRSDFATRKWVPDSGWPIPYEEYHRYIAEARAICKVPEGTFVYADAARKHRLAPFPRLRELEPVIVRLGPPVRFGELYHDDLNANKHIRCYLHATCLGLGLNESGDRIASAEVGALDGRRVRVVADQFVLAAGGIENSRILLLSHGPSGVALGNEHDRVGRFFMEHPYIDLYHAVLSKTSPVDFFSAPGFRLGNSRGRRDARLRASVQAQEGILNHTVYFKRLYSPPPEESFGERLTRLWDRVNAKAFGSERRGTYMLRIRLEHAPHADSRVTLLKTRDAFGLPAPKVDLRFGELETRTIRCLQERIASAVGLAGLGRMKMELAEGLDRWVDRAGWQFHHMGGTRMHASPRHGVVDTNCRVHGTNNLYVAGSSIFPTCGHANPTMNLVALTLRLGEHLLKEVQA